MECLEVRIKCRFAMENYFKMEYRSVFMSRLMSHVCGQRHRLDHVWRRRCSSAFIDQSRKRQTVRKDASPSTFIWLTTVNTGVDIWNQCASISRWPTVQMCGAGNRWSTIPENSEMWSVILSSTFHEFEMMTCATVSNECRFSLCESLLYITNGMQTTTTSAARCSLLSWPCKREGTPRRTNSNRRKKAFRSISNISDARPSITYTECWLTVPVRNEITSTGSCH